MGRNLYILAATLAIFAMVSCGLAYSNVAHEPGSPGDVSLWRTTGLGLLVVAIAIAISGMLSSLFEQAERRAEEQRLRERQRRGGRWEGDEREPRAAPQAPPLRLSLKQLAALRRRVDAKDDETRGTP